jgi:soluble lytic murein transglycosylase-like protein
MKKPAIQVVHADLPESGQEIQISTQTTLAGMWSFGAVFLLVTIMTFAVGAAFVVDAVQNSVKGASLVLQNNTTEMEKLRAEVMLSTGENMTYLKVMLLKPGIDKQLARDIAHSVTLRAREFKRDPDLVLAIIDVESNFNPHAVSPTGALGLMQVMPLWREALGTDRDLRDVDTSIVSGLKILASYEKIFGGLELALTAYNKGPNAVSDDMKRGKPPFNGYAESVLRTYSRIKSWTRP